uniref:phosphoserine phosphatase n=1 Tax=uncultured marine thaumarchaeote AD1000_70_G10 TaxID=1455934 RepID=A0A075G1Y8_9ARCH|nr:phosphoserine phosphatase (serB, PSPH) [uncultured marine thaumarchaeote AD1000_70_G10]
MLAIFDTEGVLIDGEFLPELAKVVGKEEEIWEITKKGISGEIEWEKGLIERINELKGVSYDDCKRVSDDMPIMQGAKETFDELRKLGFKTLTVSGGPDILIDRVKEELQIDYAFSNKLIFNEEKLQGVDIIVGSDKTIPIKDTIEMMKKQKEDIVITVDGANDIKLFDLAGLRISFNGTELINEKSDSIVNKKDLREIIPIIKEKFNLN